MSGQFKYKAFITYAHRDEERARWLRKKLENFRVPKHLIGKNSPFGPVPSRLYPIFRDRDELAGAAQLGPLIEQALHDSSHLIVLCSPHAVKSRWVNEEIRMFKAMGKADRVLCLVVDGEPMAADVKNDPDKECLPLAARRRIDQEGVITDQIHEPGAADLREYADGEKDALLKVMAGLLGVGLDELKQRDMLARQRRLAWVATASTALALSAIGLAIYAFYQQQEAALARASAIAERQAAEEELAKTQTITNFVQELFVSLDPQNTAGMDTELLKAMLDQGSIRAAELSVEPEVEAEIRYCLGKTYRSIRSYEKAEAELERVLILFAEKIRKELPTRLKAMNEIAMVHEALGNYLEAEPMLVQMLAQRTHELGSKHIEVIDAQIDLATVFRRIGKLEQAEDRCTETLSFLTDQNRTQEDPLMLKCKTELSKIFIAREKISQAESLIRNVFERSRLHLGENHVLSLRRGQVLVEALRKSDKLDDAEKLSKELVTKLTAILGETHPDTLGAMDSLAEIVAGRRDLDRALDLYLRIEAAKEEALGDMHPETLFTLKAIARIYRLQEKLNEAEKVQTAVKQRLEKKYGLEHPETLRAMNELADVFLDLGKEDDAYALSERTLDIELAVLGEQDPMTLQTMFRIGKLHYLANRKDAAMEALGDTLAKQEKLLGFDNAEATETRDLLNTILSERVTTKVLEDPDDTPKAKESLIGPPLPTFLEVYDKNESNTSTLTDSMVDANTSSTPEELQTEFLKSLSDEQDQNNSTAPNYSID
ncbi:MAG: toll/interleukin-1 receptor domain-containing protein [Opitutales bacterium]|nr:toll/interleukin-1 receptor domain-containing protein [Opitutales bacterium]